VENPLHSVGQTLALLGTPDPQLNTLGAVDFQLSRLLCGFSASDPAPNHVQPIPLKILTTAMDMAATSSSPGTHAIADMACIAFFFLLCPGEYTTQPNSTTSFMLTDIQLLHDDCILDWQTSSEALLTTANYVTLTFCTHKNGICGEALGQGASGSPPLLPCLSYHEAVAPPPLPLPHTWPHSLSHLL